MVLSVHQKQLLGTNITIKHCSYEVKLNSIPEGQQHHQDQEGQFFLENPVK